MLFNFATKTFANLQFSKSNDLAHIRPYQTAFGFNGLLSIRPQILNNLPNEPKSAE